MYAVTGSFGFIGKYITRELLNEGQAVKTVTTHPDKPNPFGDKVKASSYNFEDPGLLTATLAGCDVLVNTYWVRFNYRQWTFENALENTEILFNCAKQAGIKKIVQISVTNPSEEDDLPYYRGKALQERILKETGLDHAIVRPTLVYGKEDILVNNIAWMIRNFTTVPIFGSGTYQIQPVFVEDLASICVAISREPGSQIIDAAGPEVFSYEDFLGLIARELAREIYFVKTSPTLGILLGKLIGVFVKDVVLTRDELRGLMENKLTSRDEPHGTTLFSEWLRKNKDTIGCGYTSELRRHFYWKSAD